MEGGERWEVWWDGGDVVAVVVMEESSRRRGRPADGCAGQDLCGRRTKQVAERAGLA